jgi:hypothetical protein
MMIAKALRLLRIVLPEVPAANSKADFSPELSDAIASAKVSIREPGHDGPRVMFIAHALGGAFIYRRDDAKRRIRENFPELSDAGVERGIRHLEERAKLQIMISEEPAREARVRGSWVNRWREEE